jgi:hypothetical protein
MKGKILATFVTILISLSISGKTIAGSEFVPEVNDPEGDAPDRVTEENVSHLDILSAWIHNETQTSFKINLKMSSLVHMDNPVGTTLGIRRIIWQYADSDNPDLWWNAQIESTDARHRNFYIYYNEGGINEKYGIKSCEGAYWDESPGIFTFTINKKDVGSPIENATMINIKCESYEARETPIGNQWLYHLTDNTSFGNDYVFTGGLLLPNDNDPSVENNTNIEDDDATKKDDKGNFIPGFSIIEILIIVLLIIVIIKTKIK